MTDGAERKRHRMMILLLIIEAVLNGMKLTMAWNAWKGQRVSFAGIWTERLLYMLSVVMAVMNLLIWYGSGCNLYVMSYMDILLTYLLLAAVDIRHQIIPNKVLACFTMTQLFYAVWRLPVAELGIRLVTGILVLFFLGTVSCLSKGKIGLGDAKLLGITAVFTGIGYLLQMVFFGMVIAFLYSIFLLVTRKATVKSEFPFVPFLAMGMLVELIL